MATTHFRVQDLPDHKTKIRTHSLLLLLGQFVAKMVKVAGEADQTHQGLRRQRYAALLG
ncbi:hypothetical protein [Microvirga sp. KLBC 81]|uniref:hypothetical protein n=1 Tax=Microvirga sp. KLBC 81 TaxID=1862707 RepID=UPI001403FACE|nr:hypothetical protein [Microvirga sp. KLBC 81]